MTLPGRCMFVLAAFVCVGSPGSCALAAGPHAAETAPERISFGWSGQHGDRLEVREELSSPVQKGQGGSLFRRFAPAAWLHLRHGDTAARHQGLGRPLEGTSWLNRPYHAGWFVGAIEPSPLIDGRVDQGANIFGGYRFGKDFDHYWGTELRLAFANLPLEDGANPTVPRDNRLAYYDLHLNYYPWGDAAWRPYIGAGVGVAHMRFIDEAGDSLNEKLLHLPIAIGVKKIVKPNLALRFDVVDNIALPGAGIDMQHNLSFTAGVEVRYGGRRTSYFPWNPSRKLW